MAAYDDCGWEDGTAAVLSGAGAAIKISGGDGAAKVPSAHLPWEVLWGRGGVWLPPARSGLAIGG